MSGSGSGWATVAFVVALTLHAAVGYLILVSGLAAPLWAVLAMLVVWGLALGLLRRLRRDPRLVLSVPVVTFALWYGFVVLGGTALGWSA